MDDVPLEVLGMLPCPWSELAEGERVFVLSLVSPAGLGGVLVRAAGVVEDAVSVEQAVGGVTPLGPALPRSLRP
jgi:hypothetical protein